MLVTNAVLPRWLRAFTQTTTVALAVSSTLINLIAGGIVVRRHLTYDGDELSAADIPLAQQRAVARFIAQDWKQTSSSLNVPVFYNHGQDWVIDFGPEGGVGGGHIVAHGTPEDIANNKHSHTGKYLKRVLKGK